MKSNTSDFLRRTDRQKYFDENKNMIDESLTLIKIKNIFDEIQRTQKITIYELADIYSIIFEIDIDTVSSFFPYRTFLDIFENNYPFNTDITHTLLLLIAHFSLGTFFNPNAVINENDTSILIKLLRTSEYMSCSLNFIASICYKDQKYIQIFCEKGLLGQISDIQLDLPISNFLAFLSENHLTEYQLKSLTAFINPLLISENTQLLLNGLIILGNLIKLPYSSNILITEYQSILITRFKQFIDSNNDELLIAFLNLFHSILNLPNEMINLLFYLMSSNSENIHSYLYFCPLIFRDQYPYWKSQVDVNSLFQALLPFVSSDNISFRNEASIFLTLMRYGGYTHLCQPIMIRLLLRFSSYPDFSKMCLKAINKLLQVSNSPESLFGDQINDLLQVIINLVNNENEDISIESNLILEKVFPDYSQPKI